MTATQNKGDDNKKERKTLSLSGTLTLGAGSDKVERSTSRQNFSDGQSHAVQVVKRKRVVKGDAQTSGRQLSDEERQARARALKQAAQGGTGLSSRLPPRPAPRKPEPKPEPDVNDAAEKSAGRRRISAEEARRRELEELERIEQAEAQSQQAKDKARQAAMEKFQQAGQTTAVSDSSGAGGGRRKSLEEERQERVKKRKSRMSPDDDSRRGGRMTVTQALSGEYETRQKSLASVRRQRQRQHQQDDSLREKISREVVVPDFITVQELANRMAERAGDVVKTLMKMGMMVTVTQTIDADTAQLIVEEMGHSVKRVSESDVEDALIGVEDTAEDMELRAPVVTIMGHVDHGKTSLLDAIRDTEVAAGESGGITQHIGAYQVAAPNGQKITFIDTPGHAAFTEMRARGANTTDIVVLVVAADDGVKPQTVEAISHAKAAGVPIIVAVNKIDLPAADPQRVRNELLQYEVILEDLGGEVMAVDVSAKAKTNLDKLLEAIQLQSEVMELKANPNRSAQGAVIEAKVEQGRGSVATVLVQSGTLNVGDIFVAGSEWGKVRALTDYRGKRLKDAGPSYPVEVLGLNGTPEAGDDFVVVDSEAKARQVCEYRQRKKQEKMQAMLGRGSIEQMFSHLEAGGVKELNVLIKGDVHGSIEALKSSLDKLTEDNQEVAVKVLHMAVGAINESDVALAASTGAMIVAFNVRANAQARDAARRDGVEIRYYSIIYNVLDDAKALLSGMLDPTVKESFIGYAEVKQVFNITKVGKVAGCMVTEGQIKRGVKVRLLRDNVVIHEGDLKTLKREKDEVKEVRAGTECGIAIENYDDIKEGDVIEAFEVEEVQREI